MLGATPEGDLRSVLVGRSTVMAPNDAAIRVGQ